MNHESAWKSARRTRDTINNEQRYRKHSFDTRSNIVAITVLGRISTAC